MKEEERKVPVGIVKEAQAVYGQGEDFFTVADYRRLPEGERAELIDGRFVTMEAPSLAHQEACLVLATAFRSYIQRRQGGCRVFVSPVAVQLDCDDRTMLEPDLVVVCDQEKMRKNCVSGAPDLVVEVLSLGTQKRDRTLKLSKYKAAGVEEYWMIDLEKEKAIVYVFEEKDAPTIYGFDSQVPVHLYRGDLKIDLTQVQESLRGLP